MNNSTWMNNGSMYLVNQEDNGMLTLIRIVQVEPIVTLSKPKMKEFLKNFKCINKGWDYV